MKKIISISVIILSIIISTFSSSFVGAASVYDDYISIADSENRISLYNVFNPSANFTFSEGVTPNALLLSSCSESVVQSFTDAINNGGSIFVYQSLTQNDNLPYDLSFYWAYQSDWDLNFSLNNVPAPYLRFSNSINEMYHAAFSIDTNSNVTCTQLQSNFAPVDIFGNKIRVFENTFNVIYPVDYNGVNIDNLIFSPPSSLSASPIIDYEILDKVGKFTISNNPDSYTKIHWFITYGSIEGDVQLQTWEKTDDVVNGLNFTFPIIAAIGQDDIYGTYNIMAEYVDENNNIVSEQTNINIILNENKFNHYNGTCSTNNCLDTPVGSSDYISLDVASYCNVSAEFPFFNIDGCSNSLKNLARILSFDNLKIGSQFIQNQTDCTTLTVFNKWLNLPDGYQVCPQMPSDIRDIITPFIMFGFALITISFIGKKSGDEK